jgi:transposase
MEIADCRTRGWGQKGKPLFGKKSGKHYQRINIIAAYVNKKIIAQFQFTGKCNAEKFNSWVENYLIKVLKRGQKIIMDNASFHKSLKTKKLIESVGCKLRFLPPYSPDFNPIEKFWANMKRWIRNNVEKFNNFFDTINFFFNILTSN